MMFALSQLHITGSAFSFVRLYQLQRARAFLNRFSAIIGFTFSSSPHQLQRLDVFRLFLFAAPAATGNEYTYLRSSFDPPLFRSTPCSFVSTHPISYPFSIGRGSSSAPRCGRPRCPTSSSGIGRTPASKLLRRRFLTPVLTSGDSDGGRRRQPAPSALPGNR